MSKFKFWTQEVQSWSEFLAVVASKDRNWVFRGQPIDSDLASTLERTLDGWGIDLKEAPGIEHQLIREFRRHISDPIYNRIHEDTLNCMALMRHYGAPVRLVDCTYSPFIASKFAVEMGGGNAVIYCFNGEWLEDNIINLFGSAAGKRRSDKTRSDKTFRPMYFSKSPDKRKQFIYHENPLHLNERLTVQQAVFLCPGDVGISFLKNLQAVDGWNSKNNITKVKLKLDQNELAEFSRKLKTMNLSSAALFPGLEGFSRSLGEQILHFRQMANQNIGSKRLSKTK